MTNGKTKEVIIDGTCDHHDLPCKIKQMVVVETGEVLFKMSICKECDREQMEMDNLEVEALKQKRVMATQKDIDKNLANSMLSPLFKDRTFDNYVAKNDLQKKYVKELREFTPETNRCGYIMLGSTGTGKNHLASATVNNLISKGYTGLFTTVIKMVRAIKDSWGDNEVTEQSVIDRFTEPDILVIDEMGVQFESVTEQNYLTEIINNRYEFMKPTILLGNLSDSEFKELVGDRVLDRFRETGKRLIFDWESYRGKEG